VKQEEQEEPVVSQKKTAILVIQGLQEQKPLDALDRFSRGLAATLHKTAPALRVALSHRVMSIEGRSESYVRLGVEEGRSIDVFEYYWADLTTDKATIVDVIEWLLAVSDGAKAFYDSHPDLVNVCQRPLTRAFRNNLMETNWYLSRFGGLFKAFALIDQVFPLSQWERLSGVLKALVQPVMGFVHRQETARLVDFLGDVVAYTSLLKRGCSGISRTAVLNGAMSRLTSILQSLEHYDQVLIAGHSLGSVIAYDAVNSLIRQINEREEDRALLPYHRLKGLITFGSPLDKVAFLLRFGSKPDEYVRRQLMAQRHCFRTSGFDIAAFRRPDMAVENPYRISLDEQVYWINYWDAKDPVSGHLDFYRVHENVQCEMSGTRLEPHVQYWDYMPMYDDIARRFILQ
jgi:hypothetical protein